MEIIDTHTHLYLDQFDNDFDDMILRSFECGIKKFVFHLLAQSIIKE